jgi:transposase
MGKKYIVELTKAECKTLRELISSGKAAARKLARARILLKADSSAGAPNWSDVKISEALDVGRATVERLRRRFVEEGFDAALGQRKSQRNYQRKLDGDAEAHLIALTCSKAPEGYSRWTLRLLAERMVILEYIDQVSHETVRSVLKKMNLSLG